MIALAHIREAKKMLDRARKVKKNGFRRFEGDADSICKAIVAGCWNQQYFQTSQGHFNVFYVRDFCIAAPGLIKLGYKKEVHKTLQYALTVFSREHTLSTTISSDDRPVHIFHYSPDSLPMLLNSLRISKADELVETYKPFLEEQIDYYFAKVFDNDTGMIQYGRFSSMKDNSSRSSSCYDNCMLAMLSDELSRLKLKNPFQSYDFKQILLENFWNGRFFFDDLKKKHYVAGDANTFPFWCGVIKDKKIFSAALKSVQDAGLDSPFPLKYTSKRVESPIFPLNILLPDYETDSIWIHLGLCFIESVMKFDKKLGKKYLDMYTKNIEEQMNFTELFDSEGKPFVRRLYATDDTMIWAAKYLELKGVR